MAGRSRDAAPNPGEIAYEFLRDNEPVTCLGDLAEAPTFKKKGSSR